MADERSITVLVVDDNPSLRSFLRLTIDSEPGMETVGEAVDGRDALTKVEVLKPDVVVIDVEMPRLGGIETTRSIKQRWPETIVIGCTAIEDERIRRAMREAGASAHVLKPKATALLARMITSSTARRPRIEIKLDEEEQADLGESL